MLRSKLLFGSALAAAGLFALAGTAIASHGKVGLWEVSVTMNMGGVAMPDMSKLPPEAQARMKAMGVHMGGNTVTAQHCMTAAEVASDQPQNMSQSHNKECKMINVKMSGQSFNADMSCSGEVNATGHMNVTYDSPAHYSGKSTLVGTSNGHPVNMTQSFEGRWLKADCGGMK